jgi:hypothetical protein
MAQRRRQHENDAIHDVVGRLVGQFPEVPVDEIERAVHGKYESFTGSPVRDFVPVLVESATKRRLAGRRGRP